MRRASRFTGPSAPSTSGGRVAGDTLSSTQWRPLTGSGQHPRPGPRLAVAASEVCSRITARDKEVAVRWVPARPTVAGNEKADELAKAAASKSAPREEIPDEYRT